MESEFSKAIKSEMILIYINNKTGHYQSYHLGLQKIICQKILPVGGDRDTMYYIATVHTLYNMRLFKLSGKVFTSYNTAKSITDKENITVEKTSPLAPYLEIAQKNAKDFSDHTFYIWKQDLWGYVSRYPEGNNFKVFEYQIQIYFDHYEAKKKRKREREKERRRKKKYGDDSQDGWTNFESFGW